MEGEDADHKTTTTANGAVSLPISFFNSLPSEGFKLGVNVVTWYGFFNIWSQAALTSVLKNSPSLSAALLLQRCILISGAMHWDYRRFKPLAGQSSKPHQSFPTFRSSWAIDWWWLPWMNPNSGFLHRTSWETGKPSLLARPWCSNPHFRSFFLQYSAIQYSATVPVPIPAFFWSSLLRKRIY